MSHKIAFREYGHGPLLVLLHGYGGSVMQWDPIVDKLKDNYRVVVPNLSHLYLSDNRLLFPVIVEKVAEFIRHNFPNSKVSLAGMSFGASVAWGLGSRHPSLIERVMLFNPMMPDAVPKFQLPEVRYFFVMPMDKGAITRVFASPIGKAFLGRAGEIFRPHRTNSSSMLLRLAGRRLEFVAELIAHFAWILRNEDWEHWNLCLNTFEPPVLVAWAKDDMLFAEKSYEEFSHKIRATQTEVIAEGGHILTFSQPEWVASLCASFMDERRRHARKAS